MFSHTLSSSQKYTGFRFATHTYIATIVPYRFHLDLRHSHAHHGCPPQMDLLGCYAKLLAASRNYSLYNYPSLFGWTDECRKLTIWILFRSRSLELSSTISF
jgi:hypothetical protein